MRYRYGTDRQQVDASDWGIHDRKRNRQSDTGIFGWKYCDVTNQWGTCISDHQGRAIYELCDRRVSGIDERDTYHPEYSGTSLVLSGRGDY